ncbi:hypothetical protein E3T54_09860 [Cryobacterium sp. Sr8]|nr:hypothetical protein E3T54_09860 [Cryobacterium sp. Sr8]
MDTPVDPLEGCPMLAAPQECEAAVTAVRRRAGLVAAVAGLGLLPWFWVIEAIAGFRPVSPALGAPDQEFIDFYVDNVSRIPLNTTLFIGQWVILLVLLVSVVRAACGRLDLAAILSTTLAGAATAIYVGAEGALLWPVMAADRSASKLRDDLDPGLAQAAVLSRDGLHAPASVLLGISVLLIAWLLANSDLWGHWVMSGLAVFAGAFALSSVLVGPEGFGPGFIFVLWGPVTAVLLLIGQRRTRTHTPSPAK